MRSITKKEPRPQYGWQVIAIAAIAAAVYYGANLAKAWNSSDELKLDATAAILIDADTGEIIYEKNADEALPPASMSKMMTELIVLDYIRKGKLNWSDIVRASAYAAAVPGAGMGLSEGESLTVRELFDAMTIHSANDAAVALAEHAAGTEAAFTKLMNEKANRIGLSERAIFGNVTGLSSSDISSYVGSAHARDTVLTAKDTAMLAGYLIGKYPEVLEVTSRGSVKISTRGQALAATNLMLANKPFAYPGNDGLKTGYTPDAGYCFTGTVKRGGKRLISVVMGADSMETRFLETIKLYEIAFRDR